MKIFGYCASDWFSKKTNFLTGQTLHDTVGVIYDCDSIKAVSDSIKAVSTQFLIIKKSSP